MEGETTSQQTDHNILITKKQYIILPFIKFFAQFFKKRIEDRGKQDFAA